MIENLAGTDGSGRQQHSYSVSKEKREMTNSSGFEHIQLSQVQSPLDENQVLPSATDPKMSSKRHNSMQESSKTERRGSHVKHPDPRIIHENNFVASEEQNMMFERKDLYTSPMAH